MKYGRRTSRSTRKFISCYLIYLANGLPNSSCKALRRGRGADIVPKTLISLTSSGPPRIYATCYTKCPSRVRINVSSQQRLNLPNTFPGLCDASESTTRRGQQLVCITVVPPKLDALEPPLSELVCGSKRFSATKHSFPCVCQPASLEKHEEYPGFDGPSLLHAGGPGRSWRRLLIVRYSEVLFY